MKRLHVFILKSYLGPLLATFLISMFVLLMQFLWRYIDELVGKGLDSSVIAELLLYVSTTLVPMALPLAVLLASIMTFGNLGENYELIALKSAGISLFRIMQPLVVLTVFMTIFAFFFSNNVLPVANLKASVLLYDIKQQKPELGIKEGVFSNLEDYSIKVAKINKETGMMYDLIIYNHSGGNTSNNEVTIADSGKITVNTKEGYTEFRLFSGSVYTEERMRNRRQNEYPFRRVHYGEQRTKIAMDDNQMKRTDESLFSSSYRMLNIEQLEKTSDSLNDALAEKQKKFADSRISRNYFKRANFPEKKKIIKGLSQQQKIKEGITDPEVFSKARITENKDIREKVSFEKINSLAENAKDSKLKEPKDVLAENSKEETVNPDSLPTLSVDSIFLTLDIESKSRAIESAMSEARSVSNNIQIESNHYSINSETIRRYDIEWHKKFTLSFACLVFFFIGAPLGSIIRKGGLGTPVVISVLFFILYYIISMIGERSAREGVMDPWQGMWLSSLLLLPLGVVLTWKAVTDSEVLNSDLYINFFRKFGLYKDKKGDKKKEVKDISEINEIIKE